MSKQSNLVNTSQDITVDSSGNVGIGTSSPDSQQTLQDDSSTLGPILTFKNQYRSGSTTADYMGGIAFSAWRDISNSKSYTAGIYALNDYYPGTSGNLVFTTGTNGGTDPYNAGSERMRIHSSAASIVSIGKTGSGTSGQGMVLIGNPSSPQQYFNKSYSGSVNGILFYHNDSYVGGVNYNNTSTSFVTSSDYRLKTDAQPMTGASARVQALNPVNFEWIADGTRVDGFLAHEAQEVVPEAVTGTKDAMRDEQYEVTPAVLDDDGNVVTEAVMGTRSVPDYQGIDQSKLVPLLTAALQEALTKIDDMETRLAALEAN